MKHFIHLCTVSSALLALGLTGCQTTNQPKVRTIDPTSAQAITTVNKLDVQELSRLANDLVQSMLESGALDQAPQQPARIKVTRIRNNTMDRQDTTQLSNEILVLLTNSRKVVATATYGEGAQVVDPQARKMKEERSAADSLLKQMQGTYNAEDELAKTMSQIPYFTLSGSIDQELVKDGRTRQATFILHFILTETTTGDVIWQDQRILMKQSEKAAVGF